MEHLFKNYYDFLNEGYQVNPEDNSWAIFRLSNGKKGFVMDFSSEPRYKRSIRTVDYDVKYSDPSVPKFSYGEAIKIIQHNIWMDDKYGVVNKNGVQKLFNWRVKYPDQYPNII